MAHLRLQRLRIQAWLLLGDVVLLGVGGALCALPVLLFVCLSGIGGMLAALLTLPAALFGLAMLKVPFSSRTEVDEDGIRLQPEDAPALFDEIERVRTALAAPALDAVYLHDEFNASIRQHRVLGGKTRNVLWLGLPLLDTLSPQACAAILAHECAHIAHRHGNYASRVYFARLQWQEVNRKLDLNRTLSSAPLRLFVAWYVPRFLDISLDFARRCEYQADAEAAHVCGAAAMSEALVSLALQRKALYEYWWPALLENASARRPEDVQPFTELARHGLLDAPTDAAQARSWLHASLCEPTERTDTHPSRADRLAALGTTPDRPERELGWQRARPSAAHSWLQTHHLALAQRLDLQRAEQTAHDCERARLDREALIAEHHDLLRKQRIRTLSVDEIARQAWLYQQLDGDTERAQALLEEGLRQAPDHPGLLCQLADDHDRAGRPQAAAQLWRQVASQPGPWQPGCLRQLSVLAMRATDWEQADRYRQQADQLYRQACHGQDDAPYAPHQLTPEEVNKLAQTLAPLLHITSGVWLLREPGAHHYVLLVLARESLLMRMICRLTGEQNHIRSSCEQLLTRLLPRVHLRVDAFIIAARDPRLAHCTEAARLRLSTPGS